MSVTKDTPLDGWLLKDVVAYQDTHDLKHVHVVYLGETGFHLAHTDEERASGMDLHDCEIHKWLSEDGGPPEQRGLCTVERHYPDAYSESYRGDAGPYDFERINDGTA